MPTYTNASPGSNEILSVSQGLMLGNFQYLQTDIGTDHNFTGNTATAADGYHKVIHFVNQGSDPSVVTNIGQLYTKTVGSTQQLFYESGSGLITQLTGSVAPSIGANGYSVLPGGAIIQWGSTGSISGLTSGTVTFPITFPNSVFSITLGTQRAPTGTGQNISLNNNTPPTTSGFTWTSSSSNYNKFSWMAIGN